MARFAMEVWHAPYFSHSAKVSHGLVLVEGMSNMLPMSESGFGPGGKGAGGRLSALMESHTMAPERNTTQIITALGRKRALTRSDSIIYGDQGCSHLGLICPVDSASVGAVMQI